MHEEEITKLLLYPTLLVTEKNAHALFYTLDVAIPTELLKYWDRLYLFGVITLVNIILTIGGKPLQTKVYNSDSAENIANN